MWNAAGMVAWTSHRPSYEEALRQSRVLDRLAGFDPHVVGTLPLGIAVSGSDIDIVCHAPDASRFAEALWTHFREAAGFGVWQWCGARHPVVTRFEAQGWPFEIFGAPEPVADQAGWRHFAVERRLLALGGDSFRAALLELRAEGLKTEPAFAAALNLPDDPYAAMLALHGCSDSVLVKLLAPYDESSDPA